MKKIPKSIIYFFWGLDIVLAGLLVYLLLRPVKPDLHPENYQMQEAPEFASTYSLIENLMGNPFFVLSADRMDRLGPYELWEEINGVQWLKEREDAAIYLFRNLYDEMRTRQSWRDGDSNVEQYRLTALLTFLKQPVYYSALSPERQAAVDQCVKNLKRDKYIAVSDTALDRDLRVTEVPEMPETYYYIPAQIEDEEMEEILRAWRKYRGRQLGIPEPLAEKYVDIPDFSRPIKVFPLSGSEMFKEWYVFPQSDTEKKPLFILVKKSMEDQYNFHDNPGEAWENAFRAAAALSTEETPIRVYARDHSLVFTVGGRIIDPKYGGMAQELIDAVHEELKKVGE